MDTLKWWQQTAVYQIYPRSFQDTTGSGEGDTEGGAPGGDGAPAGDGAEGGAPAGGAPTGGAPA